MATVDQPKLSAREKKWQAEDDARTLAQANVIVEDQPRLKAAQTAAVRIAKEEKERAEAMQKVSNQKTAPKPTPKKRSPAPARKSAFPKTEGKGIATFTLTRK